MKKIVILLAMVLFAGMQVMWAQNTITGKVTDVNGSTLPGATVRAAGFSGVGTVTDMDGNYSLEVPQGATNLVFSFVGMKENTVAINGQSVINATLESQDIGLEEVVVTGVAGATPRVKLTVTVGTVTAEELQKVPASSAAGALQGKLSGVTVTSAAGNPGSAPAIRLRGSTSIYGSQAPLVIVDGVMIEGTLADINVDDIQSIDVVKGASASALYGSRAGNGVIVVTTKTGKSLNKGETLITIRNEYGTSQLANVMDISTHHQYEMQDDWTSESRYSKYLGVTTYGDFPEHTNSDSIGYVIGGAQVISDDHYMDNEFGANHDHLREFYQNGAYYTNYVSVANNSEKTNFMASFENSKQSGIIMHVNGYSRNSFRLNVNHNFSEKFFFTANNSIVKTLTDNGYMDFFSLMQLMPDMDLNWKNPLGQDYRVNVDPFGTTTNPLYDLANSTDESRRFRVMGNYALTYAPTDWLRLEAKYSFEKQNNKDYAMDPKDYLTPFTLTSGGYGGYLYNNNVDQYAQVLQGTAMINKQFGDFMTKAKFSYLYEDNHYEYFRATGFDFAVGGIYTYDNADQTRLSSYSSIYDIRAINAFGIVDVDYKSKYLGSFLYRYDGASQFGENERWNPYFRASGAYRLSEDITIPGVQEFKLRAAYGTSGNRPPYYAQYETWSLTGGNVQKATLGNKDLKPSTIKELEIGLNIDFLDRFRFEFVYSTTDAEDQHYPVPLPAVAGGYTTQWQNMGTLSSEVFEASLGIEVVKTNDFSWDMNLTMDHITQTVTKLNVAPFTYGAAGNDGDVGSFYIEEGSVFGTIFGIQFVENLDQMAQNLAYSGVDAADIATELDNYVVNSDGYVIAKGTEGTVNESVIYLLGEDGNALKSQIGDANPNFRMGIANTFAYKGFSLYALLDWKQGGDIYNLTNQWMYRDYRAVDMDQSGKEDYQKKTTDYYQSVYAVAAMNKHFVEDATYLKIREIALYYQLGSHKLNGILGGAIKGVKVGVIGRNLFTFTNYSGFDPEVGSTEGSGDATIQAWDEFAYPNFTTFSGSIEIKF